MAVTRIKSNQITDGAVTNAKIADASIQGGKLANSFTYGSDFTVSGNLTVNGTTTTVDTVTTTIDDPILLLGSNQTGAASVDLGILGERGDDTNVFVGYDESADEFVTALTSTSDSNSSVTITDYANMHVGGLTVDDNATVGGTMTATGNVTGGNLTTAGDVTTATLSTSGEATLASATVSDLTSGRVVYTGASGALQDSANLTYNGITLGTSNMFVTCNTVTSSGDGTFTGNVSGGNLTTAGDVTTATVTASGAITGSTTITATGNVTGGNLTTAGLVSATGNVTGGNLIASEYLYAADGNISNTFSVSGQASFYGDANISGQLNAGAIDGSSLNVYTGNIAGGNLSITTEATMGSAVVSDLTIGRMVYVGTDGALVDQANLTFNGSTLGSPSVESSGYITAGTYITATGNVTGGNLITSGDVTTATVTASGAITGASANLSSELVSMLNTTLYGNVTIGASADIEMNQNVIGNVGTPTSTSDAATKGYVDNLLSSGFTIADSANNQQTIAQGDTMTLNGTANEVEVTVGATDTVTIGLPDDVEVTGDLTVGGNLVVQGSQTIVDATSTSIVDPILQLGRGANNAALTANDGNDRGVAMYYYNGSEKVAFFGWDDPSSEFRFIPDATISSEEVTGSLGTANLGKVRVDAIDIDSNSITTTSGNLELSAAGTSHVKVPTGNELVIEDIANTHIVYSNAGELEGGTGLTYNGTELYADNGNIGGYLTVSGAVTATGNVTGGNLVTGGDAVVTGDGTFTGNVAGNNITWSTRLSNDDTNADFRLAGTSGTVYADNSGLKVMSSDETTSRVELGTSLGQIKSLSSSGNVVIESANVTAAGQVTATGNVSGGNLVTSGYLYAADGNVSGTMAVVGDTNLYANASVGGTLNVTGESTLASATVSDLTSGRVVYVGASGALQDSANLTYNGITLGTSNMFVTCNTVTSSGEGNFTGNVSGGNLTTSGDVTTATVTASGNVSGGNLSTGNVTIADATITATGDVTLSANNADFITFYGNVEAANGAGTFNTVKAGTVDGNFSTLKLTGAGSVIVNEDAEDVDFRVEGSSNANLVYVDAGIDSVGFGGQPTNANCTVCIESTDAIKLPVGTTAQRPTGAAGMVRYNSSTDQVEYYDVTEATFKPMGVPAFTVIASETFSGDGSTTGFTLGSDQTTQSCIISINGVVQLPTTAYAVSGNALTFTEAPESGDTIEVRQITTTTTVASLSNGDQSVTIECGDSQVDITGDVVVTGNLTFSGQNFLGQYNHSNVYVASSSDATNNTGSTLAITAGTLGFNLTQASYYQVFLNRQLLRPDEITVNLTNGTITFASDTLAANDEIEAVFLAT